MNPFLLVMFILPIITFVGSIGIYILTKKVYTAPLISAIVYFILMFTTFNSTFLVWVFIYIAISFISSLLARSVYSPKKY
ncbi:DUF2651 domain-containing protein [Bacillus sp. HMF5848]|nr:DUF2651 domain-containing protein [Bacillus sp. HMF5848]